MDAKKINFRRSNDKPLDIPVESIPTLAPQEMLDKWMNGDTEPYFKIQELEYPLDGNGYMFGEDFFKSFIDKTKERLIPGSKAGHHMDWGRRAPTDLLLVGGKVESNGDGTGKVYFKNYIPLVGDSGDNTVFIKENQTGMVDYSLVALTRDEEHTNPDTEKSEWWAMESIGYERNDAVGYGEGAMEQKTNIREDENKGDVMSKKIEALDVLKNFKTNGELTLEEVAKHLGLEAQVITVDQKANLSEFEKAKALCGDVGISETITGLQEEKKENAEKMREVKINELFGPAVNPVTKKENDSRAFAVAMLGDAEITEEKVKEIKENSTFKNMAALIADVNSEYNRVETQENAEIAELDGPVVVTV